MSTGTGPGASTEVDVAIVGAGPVGQLLALLLGRSGWRVEVLERRPHPFALPRAVHLDHEAARILQGAGVMQALAPRTEAMDAYEWRNGSGQVLLSILGGTGGSGWPESLMFCQADLELALARGLEQVTGCHLRWQWEVDALAERPGGYEVSGTQADGSRAAVVAKWVVACDGANSTTRALLDVPVEDFGYSFDWVVVDIVPRSPQPWSPLNIQVCDPARPTTAVSGGPGRRRFEFLCLPGETLDQIDRADVIWELLERWDLSPANAALERHAGYTFRSRLASQWQAGSNSRVLLAGDAAHQMPPFAGQGLCSGLRDVANLAWKLDLVLSGAAREALLATYASERSPGARGEIELSVALGQLVCVLGPAEAAGRDAAMVPAAMASGPIPIPPPPPLGPGLTKPGDPHAGHLGRQGVVGRGGRRGLFDDVVTGRGWALLSPHGDPMADLAPPLADWYRGIGGRSAHVAPGAPVDDVEGTYARWFAELGASVVLQRPDFRLFGVATGSNGAAELVQAARDALTGRYA